MTKALQHAYGAMTSGGGGTSADVPGLLGPSRGLSVPF